ncbi:MAG: hypothetical protein NTV22_09090, partial [bacterium]|nr:hypothetical protein [bacterium]
MTPVVLTRDQQGTVVFWLWRSLPYLVRMLLGFGCIIDGLALQIMMAQILPGCLLVALGNALLLVRGYNNRVDAASYDAAAAWERVELAQVQQIKELHGRMQRWDRSAVDISNGLGGFVLVLLAGILLLAMAAFSLPPDIRFMLVVNSVILLLPHWVTGTRRVLTQPALLIKIATY